MTELESYVREIIEHFGDDPKRDGLKKTPSRVMKSFNHLTSGYRDDLDVIMNGAIFDSPNTDMVLLKDIEFYSLCEHHLLPFYGNCHIAYIPSGKVLGLSKLARVVDHFSRRFQIQETLTIQIAKSLQHYLNTEDVAVMVEAKHMCMMMRGVNKQSSTTSTSCMLGEFQLNDLKHNEFVRRVCS